MIIITVIPSDIAIDLDLYSSERRIHISSFKWYMIADIYMRSPLAKLLDKLLEQSILSPIIFDVAILYGDGNNRHTKIHCHLHAPLLEVARELIDRDGALRIDEHILTMAQHISDRLLDGTAAVLVISLDEYTTRKTSSLTK